MFEIGFSEILITAVLALVVLGPKRLPHAARLAGLWVKRARTHWASVRAELERELELERVRADIDAASASMQAPMQDLQSSLRTAQAELDAAAPRMSALPDPMASTPATPADPAAAPNPGPSS